jgi:hypothetical protein
MTLTRALASIALTMALPRTALAGDWQYCLAPSHAEHKVYMSAPFPAGGALATADHLFDRRLEQAGIRHDDVQCPRANGERAALVMRQHAIAFNQKLGNTIIPLRFEAER